MKIIKARFEFLDDEIDRNEILKRIELCGRVCYKSEDAITTESASKFVSMLVKNGHHSVLEHESISVRIICDRGVSHEIVRHRLASYSQESTRYCNYSSGKFDKEISVIDIREGMKIEDKLTFPEKEAIYSIWFNHMENSAIAYNQMIKAGATSQIARSVLPNSLKTEIIVTYNLREWMWFFIKRCDEKAHPQMREISIKLFNEFYELLPEIFGYVLTQIKIGGIN